VVAVAASYDQTLRYGAQTPFSDQLAFQWTGSLWEYDAQHDSLITAGNGGTKPLLAAFTIYYNQGTQKYQLEQFLQPDEQMWIDVGKLIREQARDKNGNVLPQDLTFGSFEFRDLTNKFIGNLFEGKVVYDKTYGHVTYGCSGCCGYTQAKLWYDPLFITLGTQQANGVNAYTTCSQTWDDVNGAFYGNWTTVNGSIATVNYYGTHTGVNIGSTTSNTFGYLDGSNAKTCPIVKKALQGSDIVGCDPVISASNITQKCDGTTIYLAKVAIGGTDFAHIKKIIIYSVTTNNIPLIELLDNPYVDPLCGSGEACFDQEFKAQSGVLPATGAIIWDIGIFCQSQSQSTPDWEVKITQTFTCQ
jgi:hypothetical protein